MLKQTEYNLRVSAAKVYKLESSRRARAEKKYREEKTHWMYTEKKLRAQAESEAHLLRGKLREHAKKKEVKRREESKEKEKARKDAEAAMEEEARRRAGTVETEADAKVERAARALQAAVEAREERHAAEKLAKAEAVALEPSPSPAPMPESKTEDERQDWEERARAHDVEVAAREAAAKIVVDRANAAHEEKVRSRDEEVKARAAGAAGRESNETVSGSEEGLLARAEKIAGRARADRDAMMAEAKTKVEAGSPHWKKAAVKAKMAADSAERVERKFGPETDDKPLKDVNVDELKTQREAAIAEALTKAGVKSPHWKKAAAKAKEAGKIAARVERKMGPGTDHSDSSIYNTWLARGLGSLGWGGSSK